jgi:hypothetical protein
MSTTFRVGESGTASNEILPSALEAAPILRGGVAPLNSTKLAGDDLLREIHFIDSFSIWQPKNPRQTLGDNVVCS